MPAQKFRTTETLVEADGAWREAQVRLAVFTSPRAVSYGLPRLGSDFLDQVLIAAIGPGTRRALETNGFDVDFTPLAGFTSEDLLNIEELHVESGAAIILTAPGGRQLISPGLAAMGWGAREVHVYERVLVAPPASAVQALIDCESVLSTWTSGEALAHLFSSVPAGARDKLRGSAMLVPSERLRQKAIELGAVSVHLAEGADNRALLAGVKRLKGGQD